MRNSVRRTALVLTAAGLALAVSVGTASADDGSSARTTKAWHNWDQGGEMLGHGAAKMVSGAWIGAPSSILDLANEDGMSSPRTEKAWKNWDEGGALVGGGAAKMVSGAWIGAPSSILDLAQDPTGDVTYLDSLPAAQGR